MSGREFKKGRETQADPWLQRFRKRTDLNGLEFVDFSYTYTKKLEPFSKTLAHNQIGYENYLKKTPQELSIITHLKRMLRMDLLTPYSVIKNRFSSIHQ